MVRSRLTARLGAQNESSIVTCVNASGTYCRRTALSAVSGGDLSVAVLKFWFLCCFHIEFPIANPPSSHGIIPALGIPLSAGWCCHTGARLVPSALRRSRPGWAAPARRHCAPDPTQVHAAHRLAPLPGRA